MTLSLEWDEWSPRYHRARHPDDRRLRANVQAGGDTTRWSIELDVGSGGPESRWRTLASGEAPNAAIGKHRAEMAIHPAYEIVCVEAKSADAP